MTSPYSSSDFLRDRAETAGEGDDRDLVDQIEFADVIVLKSCQVAEGARLATS